MNTPLGISVGDAVTIKEAYDELSQEAFAVWMRLLVTLDSELARGRAHLAATLGYSEGRSNAILRELRHKCYIKFVKAARIGQPTTIQIQRRALISGPARIIRLGGNSTPNDANSAEVSENDKNKKLLGKVPNYR